MTNIPNKVKKIWANRECIEVEAAALFSGLSTQIKRIWGVTDPIVQMAEQAYDDEQRHAILCQKILGTKIKPEQKLDYKVQLGPESLSPTQQIIYTAISLSCVTETLSTALLLEMKNLAQPKIIKDTVHEILTDEIRHSRIGWAILARIPKGYDLTWVQKYIPGMLEEAYQAEVKPMQSNVYDMDKYASWGVLSPKKSNGIVIETINSVINPGLKKFNIVYE